MEASDRAREVLAATLGIPVKSDTEIDLSDRDQVWTDRAIEAMLAFRNAALEEAAGEWIETCYRLPEKPGLASYEHVWCLIFHHGEIKLRPWNCEHLCWDDADGDDWFCNPLDPTHWRPLPNPPALKAKG